jgi:hypothetical protein
VTPNDAAHLERWRRRLVALCMLFALVGASWVVLGSLDPLGLYERLLARAFFGAGSLGPLAGPVFRFMAGLLGATTAAFFVLAAFVVEHAFPARWAYRAVWAAVLTWFVLNSALSLFVGATFNVAVVNVPCLVALAVPLLALRRHVGAEAPEDRSFT